MKNFYILLLAIFTFNSLLAQFAPYREVSPRLSTPSWLASGDIDGDGDQDLITTSHGNGEVAWYQNLDQNGSFSQQRIITISNSLRMVEVVDLDDDGDLDLLGISRGDNVVVWIENLDGEGHFGEQQLISDQIYGGESAYSADFDNDGDLDVVSASRYDNKIAWYERIDGTNEFGNQQIISNTAEMTTFAVPADMDGDNDMDIVAAIGADDQVVVYHNDGLGNFGNSEVIVSTIDVPNIVFAKDFDGDNDIDLVVSGVIENDIYYIENVNGTFNTPENLTPGIVNSDLYFNFGDMDGDGDPDIIGAFNSYDQELFWLTMESNGHFSSRKIIETDDIASPHIPIILDINGDGRGEPIFAGKSGTSNGEHQITFYNNPSNYGLEVSEQELITSALGDSRHLNNADMDGDGDLDIVAAAFFMQQVLWYENRDALFDFGAPHLIFDEQSAGHKAMEVVDLDNDGDNDVVLSTYFFPQYRIHWLENDGTGKFLNPSHNITSLSNFNATAIEVADVNNDNALDLVFVTPEDNKVTLRINNGSESFTQQYIISSTTTFPNLLKAADMDGDNDIDLLVGSTNNDYIQLFDNINGTSFWSNITTISLGDVKDYEAGDLDNDGDLEVVAINGSQLLWYKNMDGSNDFDDGTVLPSSGPFDIAIGDMDNDGLKDIVIGEDSFYGVGWTRNVDGEGTFEDVPLTIFYNSQANYVQLGDFDSDGDLDISYVQENSSNIGWIPSLLGESLHIAGNLFFDENENGIKDNDEFNLKNRKLTLAPLNLTTWSDNEGNYSFPAKVSDYDLVCLAKEDWKFTTDSTYQISLDGSADTTYINFGITVAQPVKEARVDISSNATRCGFEVPFYFDVLNTGNLSINGTYHLQLDTLTTLVNSSITPDSIVDNHLYWSFADLIPTGSTVVELVLLMPDENYDGDFITFLGDVELMDEVGIPYFTDSTTYVAEISCAIDPNDKVVSPSIPGFENYTIFGEILDYTIRFQNTGSDTAINIVITDNIDPSFDLETFEVISASHNYIVTLDDDRIVTFQFPNIYLPDSTTNNIESMGYIKYQIRPYPDLDENTTINNFAEIYFDFNDPIITNTVNNIMVSEYPFMLNLQPPSCFEDSNGSIFIDFPLPNLTYHWDTGFNGQLLDNIPSGEYFVTVTNPQGLVVGDTIVILNQPEELTLNLSSTNATQNNQDGTATATPNGGTPPYSYTWSTSPEQTTQTATNLSGGEYTAIITDANDCTISEMVTVEQTVATSNFDSELSFSIAPNPGKGDVKIFFELSHAARWELTIYNNLGQVIQYENSYQEKERVGIIPIKILQPGIYSVMFQYDGQFISDRFIVM